MDIQALIAKHHADRKTAGLTVSFDRETPELTATYGRATRSYATEIERDAGIARLTAKGRNPKIEGAH